MIGVAGHDDVIVDALFSCSSGENDHVSLATAGEGRSSKRDDGRGEVNVGGRESGEDGWDVGGAERERGRTGRFSFDEEGGEKKSRGMTHLPPLTTSHLGLLEI